MSTNSSIEHFCTLFDRNYLPLGMALHESLMTHACPFHLWILCIDEQVEQQLRRFALPNVTLMPLRDVETSELLAVKPGRTIGEYCWTLTPFTFQAVFNQDSSVKRVTYLDADLFFFASPNILLKELEPRRHVLFTEHAYAPEYDQSKISGRFCVQFLTFRATEEAFRVMKWWQVQCLRWCFNRVEDGKFGDQRYLDYWTELFGDDVQIVQQVEKTLAPWNVKYYEQQAGILTPVFYHFHTLKIVNPDQVQLYSRYQIGPQGLQLYKEYLAAIRNSIQRLEAIDAPIPSFPLSQNLIDIARRFKWKLTQETRFSLIQ